MAQVHNNLGNNFIVNTIEIQKDEKSKSTYTLEDAIKEAKIGKCQLLLTVLTGIILLGSTVENTNVSFILPYAKCDLKLSTHGQGVLNGISYFGIVFSSHLWGFLADTWGRRNVLRVAATGGCIFSFLSVFSMNTITMVVLRFAAGFFVAGATSAGYSYISEFYSSATASRAAAFISIGMYGVCPLLSPLAMLIVPMDWSYSLYFVQFKPWRLFLLCGSLLNLWNAIVSNFLPESPKFLLTMNRKEEAIEVLSRVYAMNTGNSKYDYPVKDIEQVALGNSLSNAKGVGGIFKLAIKQTTPIFRKPLLQNTWKFSYIIFVLFLISHGSFAWLPAFLHTVHSYKGAPQILCEVISHVHKSNSTEHLCNVNNKNLEPFQMLFLAGVFFMFTATVASYCLDKIRPKILICSWLVLSMISGVLLNFVTNFYEIVVCYVAFICCMVCSSIIMAVAVNLYPTSCRAMATSFIMLVGRLGSANGSSVIGLMLHDHCTLIYYVFGGFLISCSFVFAMVKIRPQ